MEVPWWNCIHESHLLCLLVVLCNFKITDLTPQNKIQWHIGSYGKERILHLMVLFLNCCSLTETTMDDKGIEKLRFKLGFSKTISVRNAVDWTGFNHAIYSFGLLCMHLCLKKFHLQSFFCYPIKRMSCNQKLKINWNKTTYFLYEYQHDLFFTGTVPILYFFLVQWPTNKYPRPINTVLLEP